MDWLPSTSDKVVSSQFGPATVSRVDRRSALIRLDSLGIEVEVQIETLSPEYPGKKDQPDYQDSPTEGVGMANIRVRGKSDAYEKRKAVEALRFGLVPETEIESLTLHYQDLLSWVLSRLPNVNGEKPQVSEIYGPFGSGKSHTMATIRYVAAQQDYITAHVEIDGLTITLSDPERLLYSLWNSLKANKSFDSSTPVLSLCLRALQAGFPPPSIAPQGPDRVQDNYSTARLINRSDLLDKYGHALNAIMSSSNEFTASQVSRMISRDPNIFAWDVRVRRMIGQRVADRPYDFIETWVGYAVLSKLAGYKGLVITIDEFEVGRLLDKRIGRASDLLSVLGDYLKGELDHPTAALGVFFATVGEDGHQGDKFVDQLIDEVGGSYYPLPTFSRADRLELSKRIFKLYSEAFSLNQEYSHSVVDVVEKELEMQGAGDSGLVRRFIKSYLSALDSLHGPSQ